MSTTQNVLLTLQFYRKIVTKIKINSVFIGIDNIHVIFNDEFQETAKSS